MTQDSPNAPDPKAVDEVAVLALSVKQDLPCNGDPWRVCIRCDDGPTSAAFTLHGYEQVLLFERRLEVLGYEMLMLDERFRHCDFALTARAWPSHRLD